MVSSVRLGDVRNKKSSKGMTVSILFKAPGKQGIWPANLRDNAKVRALPY
jgi:hypothetical protein